MKKDITQISKMDCKTLAGKIRENVFTLSIASKTSIFLCGADIKKKDTIRHKVAEVLTNNYWYSSDFHLVFPEDIFDDLLYNSKSTDLLSLENMLADSVDAVIVIPESPGSFTELGAFANNEKLREKLICVLDIKYKKDKSFINQGPVKLVKKANKECVVYINVDKIGKGPASNIKLFWFMSEDSEVEKILSPIKQLKKRSNIVGEKVTLLQLDKFLLPTIFLLEPVSRSTLIEIVGNAIEDQKNATTSTITALTILSKNKFVELTPDGYKLTELGAKEFLEIGKKKNRNKHPEKREAIDQLRLEILNLKYRNKKLKV